MDVFNHFNVLSLRQMAMTKLAITVGRDPEIMDFVKTNGCASFIFPSRETHLYLDAKSQMEERWISKDFLISYTVSNMYMPPGEPYDFVTRKNILPFARWEELVEERIFALPQPLQQELLDVVRSVNIEIDKWIKYHYQFWPKAPEIAYDAQRYFQWNSFGKIDRGKTARFLISNVRLNIEDHYILTSLYNLMDKKQREERWPDEIVQKYSSLVENKVVSDHGVMTIRRKESYYFRRKDSFITLHFFRKREFVKEFLREECLQYEDFLFYLSHMLDVERKKVFEKRAFKILQMYFLDWPLQCMFLKAAEQLLPYFTEREFLDMLKLIIYERIMLCRKDFNYIDLLKEFWSLSPSRLQESIETDSIYESVMLIINFPDGEIFPGELLLESSNADCLTFRYCGVKYCLVRTEKPFDFVEFFRKNSHRVGPPPVFSNLFSFGKELKGKYNLMPCSGAE
ncbi:uncharacterized protein TNCT_67301 [Trichonephila clavata]|uniref:Uncharacterized protein n=1 Tax=Trichonephila clavata TaxID=2740835 RepID=A0A8X6JMK6_TRICU|nr:uncharacterized protein TNCT_67301 [Trichonephila clavata]